MALFWKVTAGTLVAALLGMSLGRDFSAILCLAVCAMGMTVALEFIRPVVTFFQDLSAIAALPAEHFRILLKVLGISLTTQIASCICADTGSGALGNMLKMLALFLILWICLPLFQQCLGIIQQILGGI